MNSLAQYRKTLVAAVAFLLNVIAAASAVGGLIPAEALPYVNAFVLVAGAYGVYRTPNAAPSDGPDHRA